MTVTCILPLHYLDGRINTLAESSPAMNVRVRVAQAATGREGSRAELRTITWQLVDQLIFWASEWFESILKTLDLRNHEQHYKHKWKWAFVTTSLCFLTSFNTFIKNVVISLDGCKKCSVTSMELFNNIEIPVRFLILLICEFQNY